MYLLTFVTLDGGTKKDIQRTIGKGDDGLKVVRRNRLADQLSLCQVAQERHFILADQGSLSGLDLVQGEQFGLNPDLGRLPAANVRLDQTNIDHAKLQGAVPAGDDLRAVCRYQGVTAGWLRQRFVGLDGFLGRFCQVEVGELLFRFLNRLAQQVRISSSFAEQLLQDASSGVHLRLPGGILGCKLTPTVF